MADCFHLPAWKPPEPGLSFPAANVPTPVYQDVREAARRSEFGLHQKSDNLDTPLEHSTENNLQQGSNTGHKAASVDLLSESTSDSPICSESNVSWERSSLIDDGSGLPPDSSIAVDDNSPQRLQERPTNAQVDTCTDGPATPSLSAAIDRANSSTSNYLVPATPVPEGASRFGIDSREILQSSELMHERCSPNHKSDANGSPSDESLELETSVPQELRKVCELYNESSYS